jgi:hypothetical protein
MSVKMNRGEHKQSRKARIGMQMNSVSALTVVAIIAFSTSPASAQDKFDYADLISKDGNVEGATKIDIAKAYELYNEGVLFIDVNTPLRYKFAHIPGAWSAPHFTGHPGYWA